MMISRVPIVLAFLTLGIGGAASRAADCLGIVKYRHYTDVPAFVETLLGDSPCQEYICAADVNDDGIADGADVGPFIDCILAVSCAPQSLVRINEVMPFEWADGDGAFRFYNSLNGTQGLIEGGDPPHSSIVSNGELHLTATTNHLGTSFAGRFLSLRGKDNESDLTVALSDPMPEQIQAPYRVSVDGVRIRIRGSGRYRLEIKDGNGNILWNLEDTVSSASHIDRIFSLPGPLPNAKLLSVIAESTPTDADIYIDRIDLVTTVPQSLIDDPLLYGALTSYCQLLRAFDDDGYTRDRNTAGEGEFNSVPAMGFQILAAAIAEDLGFISLADAQAIAESSVSALLTIPTETMNGSGLLPHFLALLNPEGEFSSIDTALTCIPTIQGLCALGMAAQIDDVYTQIVDHLDFAQIMINGELSHGVSLDGNLLSSTWDRWGGELTLVELLRAMRDPTLAPPVADRTVEHYGGVGFIVELAALFAPEFGMPEHGADLHGVNWHERRLAHLAAQKDFVSHALFGLSATEIIQYTDSSVDYLVAGIGKADPITPPESTLCGFGPGPWLSPHYMSVVASLEPANAEARIVLMRDTLRLWGPLNGPPESLELAGGVCSGMWHRLQVTLNSTFNLIGLYHAIRVRDGGKNVVYSAVDCDTRLRLAVDAVFHGPLSPPPAQIRLEGESGIGPGSIMARGNASGGLTRWLHAGEELEIPFAYPHTIDGWYSVTIRYSNDNLNTQPNEEVTLMLNGTVIGGFTALDTGDGGFGWNSFEQFTLLEKIDLVEGNHVITVSPSGGDSFGIEIDYVELHAL